MPIEYRKHEKYPETILIRDFTGKVTIENIIESWENLFNKNMINNETKGVINNLSGCELCMDFDNFPKLLKYLKGKENLNNLKLAVVCDNPKNIVFPMMGEKKEPDLKIKPFSTLDAAVNWITFNK